MLRRTTDIERIYPGEWEDVDPDAGWVRPALEQRGSRRPTVPWARIAVALALGAVAPILFGLS